MAGFRSAARPCACPTPEGEVAAGACRPAKNALPLGKRGGKLDRLLNAVGGAASLRSPTKTPSTSRSYHSLFDCSYRYRLKV